MEKSRHPILEENHDKKIPFFVCKLTNATLKKAGPRKIIEVNFERNEVIIDPNLDDNGLSQDLWIQKLTQRKNPSADYLRHQMEIYEITGKAEIANIENPIRWLGSGSLLVLKTHQEGNYLVLNQRQKPFAWGDFFDGNGGYSSSYLDMLQPQGLAFRELKEELSITKDGHVIELTPDVVEIVQLKNPTRSITHYKGQTFINDDLFLIIDPETGTVDFRQMVSYQVGDLNNLILEDRETKFINKTKQVLQHRPVFLYPLDKVGKVFSEKSVVFPKKGFLNGKEIEIEKLADYSLNLDNLTPVVKLTLQDYFS